MRRNSGRSNSQQGIPPKSNGYKGLLAQSASQGIPPNSVIHQTTIPPAAPPLELGVEVERNVDGIEMGILQNGLPYLTQSGLSKAIGIGQSTLSKITKEWREAHSDPVMPRRDSRLGYLKEYLHKERFSEPELYIEVEVENATHYAYPSVVCMALIEYYAFESHPPKCSSPETLPGFRAIRISGIHL